MRLHIHNRLLAVITAGIVSITFLFPLAAYAQTPTSPNYSTREYNFGTGGDPNLNSANYSARTSAGTLAVNNSLSAQYGTNTGPITPDQPYIEFVVGSTTVNLGTQTTTNTSQGTATFYVKAYVASGYVVRNASPGLAIPSHTMASPSVATTSAVGTEQFGINLVANSCALCLPLTSFGAAPVQIPDSTFSFGTAASGYNTPNNYKYQNNDVIAQSTKSSGETDYTISYILNISNTTPAGNYVMNHVLVATGTY